MEKRVGYPLSEDLQEESFLSPFLREHSFLEVEH